MDDRYAKIEGYEDFVKDQRSGAILLSNHVKANEYLAKKRQIEESSALKREINTIKERLDDFEIVKNDIQTIKSLLQQLAGNGTQ